MAEPGVEKPTSMVTGESGPGTGLTDFLPVPTSVKPVTEPDSKETFDSLHQDATLSHALATDDHDHKGAAQQDHDNAEVQDLGWNEDKEHIARPLVGGMDNEELWLLVRRFNKVRAMSRVRGNAAALTRSSKCTMSRQSLTPCPVISTST